MVVMVLSHGYEFFATLPLLPLSVSWALRLAFNGKKLSKVAMHSFQDSMKTHFGCLSLLDLSVWGTSDHSL